MRPVKSKSEAGTYTSYGEQDMKVLRRDADAAHEFFYGPPKSDNAKCIISVIDDGKLVPPGTERSKTVIRRWLQPYTDDEGNRSIYLMYEDGGLNTKGSKEPLGKVNEINIRDGYLCITGTLRGNLVKYKYKIRENSDSFKAKPIPKGQPKIDDYGTPKERPKAKPAPAPAPKSTKKRVPFQEIAISRAAANSIIRYFKGTDPSNNFELPRYLATFDEHVAGYQYAEMTSYFLHRDHGKILREDGLVVKNILIDEDYLAIRCEGPLMPSDYFLIRDDLDHYAGETPTPKAKPVEKPAVKPKPTKKKAPTEAPKTAKKGITYEVRVSGSIRGSYSSKAKAEAHKRDLKSKGEAAKVYVVGY